MKLFKIISANNFSLNADTKSLIFLKLSHEYNIFQKDILMERIYELRRR